MQQGRVSSGLREGGPRGCFVTSGERFSPGESPATRPAGRGERRHNSTPRRAAMGLRERLDEDMKQSLRSRDTLRLETIRGVRGAVRNREIEVGGTLDE